MNWDDIKGLKYFIAYALVILGFFVYSGITGWRWINPTKTESERSTTRTGHVYRYHK